MRIHYISIWIHETFLYIKQLMYIIHIKYNYTHDAKIYLTDTFFR